MSLTYRLEELLDYSDHERAKWQTWIAANPQRLDIVCQPGGRFSTVGSLLDHIFLVERRHLARVQGGTPPESTGVAPGDLGALFEYGALVRADFRRCIEDLDDQRANEQVTFTIGSTPGTFQMTRRKLCLTILLHETRHLAQAALAARIAGDHPPGEHDLFYFTEFA
jgi:uncharacterized damage-inducible protein DinB